MKIQTDAPILDLNREKALKKGDLRDQWGRITGPDPDSDDFLVRDAVAEAMIRDVDGETASGSNELKKLRLTQLFADNDVVDYPTDFKKEERAFIMERAVKAKLPTLIYGRLHEALHPKDDDTADEEQDDDE